MSTFMKASPLLLLITIFLAFIIAAKISSNKNRSSYQNNQEHRNLCRSQSNRVVAGVCGGIAEYFGWNATVVRLFFLFSGIGILTYAILAIVIPDSPSPLL